MWSDTIKDDNSCKHKFVMSEKKYYYEKRCVWCGLFEKESVENILNGRERGDLICQQPR